VKSSRAGITVLATPLLADGEWHSLTELGKVIAPALPNDADLEQEASGLASQMNCERQGIRGRDDQQVRWRLDLYLDREVQGHDRGNFKAGADTVLRALVGLRSFQALLIQPGQYLNPAQRYWIDKALQLTKEKINEDNPERPAQGS
jgi:hypothetical protein